MRAVVVVMLLLSSLPARADGWVLPDEDDPKLARAVVRRPWWKPDHPVPRFKLAYRRLVAAGLEGGDAPFDVIEVDFYPVSSLVRFGLDGEFGWAGGDYSLWYLTVGTVLGVQYPARVT